jgi:peptide deformylase
VSFDGSGLLARCLQHETDHLFGTVFGDRIPERARKRLYKQHEQIADDYPGDWPANLVVDGAGVGD